MGYPLARLAARATSDGSRVGLLSASGSFADLSLVADRWPSPLLAKAARHRTIDEVIASESIERLHAELNRISWSELGPDDLVAGEQLRLLAPVRRPSKVIGIGLNVGGLVGGAVPALDELPRFAPFWFMKAPSAVIGSLQPIVHPGRWHTEHLIPEPELGLVVGRRCGPDVATPKGTECAAYVAGFLNFNDVSAIDIEFKRAGPPFAFNLSWSKSYPTFAPLGPALVLNTPDLDPCEMPVRMTVSGETIVSANTRDMLWSPWELIEYFASVLTLEPGDVISCGNFPPVSRDIWPGDEVTVEVGPLGQLTNPVIATSHETRYVIPERVKQEADRYREGIVKSRSSTKSVAN